MSLLTNNMYSSTTILIALLLFGALPTMTGCTKDSENPALEAHTDHDEDSHGKQVEQEADDGDDHDEHAGEGITIDEGNLERYGVELTISGMYPISLEIEVAGEIVTDPDRIQHVTPRYSGVVRKVNKHVGDRVRAGEQLALIENNETLTSYALRAAINGVIIEEHVPLGESLEEGHEAFLIADTSKVWIDLQVFPEDLNQVKVGQLARLIGRANSTPVAGRLSYVSPVIDHASRTGTARLEVENKSGELRPGLFVSANIIIESTKAAVAVPSDSVLRDGSENIVIIRDDDGEFLRREVIVGRKGKLYTEILEGITVGQRIVSKGGFLMKSEIGKGAMGGGHSH